jgi:hypothetical protein
MRYLLTQALTSVNRHWWIFFFNALPWSVVSAYILILALLFYKPVDIIEDLNSDFSPEEIEPYLVDIYIQSFTVIAVSAMVTFLPIAVLLYARFFWRKERP